MNFPAFLSALFEDGRLRVPAWAPIPDADTARADAVLADFEREYRQELPGMPPPLSLPAARWAAVLVFRACQLLVLRSLGEEAIAETCSTPCPAPASAGVHYSADLTLRFLPDLLRMARAASSEDPLGKQLLQLAAAWPLSSVGISGVGPVTIDAFASDPCLMAIYVDRVIAAKDKSRLTDPRVLDAVRAAIGLHEDLAPELAAADHSATDN